MQQGRAALERALALRPAAGPYVLQAAIASLQAEPEIDWHEVALLYERLERLTGSPVVTLNRAVAIAEAGMPERALEIVDALELGDYRYLPSTRAELLRRLGRSDEARAAFAHALAAGHHGRRAAAPRSAAGRAVTDPTRQICGSRACIGSRKINPNATAIGTRHAHAVTASACVGRWSAKAEKKIVPRAATPIALDSSCTASSTPEAEPTSSIVTPARMKSNS